MVKRGSILPGAIVQINKVMPGEGKPGPKFQGEVKVGDNLIIRSEPFKDGGLNLVKVEIPTGQRVDFIYSFITNFCTLVPDRASRDG
jgi:hypothetical protein